MTSEQLWIIVRRALGVYFLVSAGIGLPGVLASLGAEPADSASRWFLPVVLLSQTIVTAFAGWWLVRGAIRPPPVTAPTVWPDGGLRIVLQVLGVYFVVGGAASMAEWVATLLLMDGESWRFAASHLTGSAAELLAGALLVARPSGITRRIAAFP